MCRACGDMSITHLEKFVSLLVRGSNEIQDRIVEKPRWWPPELEFEYPIARKQPGDSVKWRHTLLNLVARCYRYGVLESNASQVQKTVRWNLRKNKRINVESVCTPSESKHVLNEFYSSLPHELSPVVVVHDILEVNLKRQLSGQLKHINRNNYFNYLKLNHGNSTSKMDDYKLQKYCFDLFNIPLTSNLGAKIIKRRRKELQITQKKLKMKQQIIEKYCSDRKPISKTRTPFNPAQGSRRSQRNKENLSTRARYLMQKCNPCIVSLTNLNITNISKSYLIERNNNDNFVEIEEKEDDLFNPASLDLVPVEI